MNCIVLNITLIENLFSHCYYALCHNVMRYPFVMSHETWYFVIFRQQWLEVAVLLHATTTQEKPSEREKTSDSSHSPAIQWQKKHGSKDVSEQVNLILMGKQSAACTSKQAITKMQSKLNLWIFHLRSWKKMVIFVVEIFLVLSSAF